MEGAQYDRSALPKYKCHKEVWALKISTIDVFDGRTVITPENTAYMPFEVADGWVEKHDAKAGGYWVLYKDGYTSWSPADAFEDGYLLIPEAIEGTKWAAEAKEQVQKPTQGRIVLYHHPGSLDGKYPPQTSPAIIQQADSAHNPMRAFLFVFGPKGQHMDWAEYGIGPCQWSWPGRV